MKNINNNQLYYNPRKNFIEAFVDHINLPGTSFKNLKEMTIRYLKRQKSFRNAFGIGNRTNRGNLAVFVVRENALDLELVPRIHKIIERYGFLVLNYNKIKNKRVDYIIEKTRGSNWSTDSKSSLGKPEAIFVVFDPNPLGISRKTYQLYPEMDNGRLAFKRIFRYLINHLLPHEKHSNFLHATDSEKQAWKYLKIINPEIENKILAKLILDYEDCPICGPKITMVRSDDKMNCRKCNYSISHKNIILQHSKNKFRLSFLKDIFKFIYLGIWWKINVYSQRRYRRKNFKVDFYHDYHKPKDNNYPVDISKIKYFYGGEKYKEYFLRKFDIGLILDGDWEDRVTSQRFENMTIYKSVVERYSLGKSWTETDYFEFKMGPKSRNRNIFKKLNHFQRLDRLYYSMVEEGYKSQKEISGRIPNARAIQGWGEIAIHIGQHGDLYLSQGRHRAAFAKVIGIRKVLANIIVRHKSWFDFKKEIIAYSKENSGMINYPLTHVDLQFINSHSAGDGFEIINKELSPNNGRILDLGANWGYYCHIFEDQGFECYAIEENSKDFYFLEKLKRSDTMNFSVYNSFQKMLGENVDLKFDYVLAIDVLHKYWLESGGKDKLKNILTLLKTEVLFFQHTLTKDNYSKINEEEIIDFIIDNSNFSTYSKIGMTNENIPILKFELN